MGTAPALNHTTTLSACAMASRCVRLKTVQAQTHF